MKNKNNGFAVLLRRALSGKNGKVGLWVAFVLLAILGMSGLQPLRKTAPPSPTETDSAQTATKETTPNETRSTRSDFSATPDFPAIEVCSVERVIDGDTILVHAKTGRQRVRFIGCNTPETVKPGTPVEPFGPEASAHTKERIAEFDHIVTLEADGDRYDPYGRRLALVWLGPNRDILLNEELVQRGLARVAYRHNYSQATKERYRQAENRAKKERIGLWALPEPPSDR